MYAKFLFVRPIIKSQKISVKDQKEYWSDQGMLLFLVKHLRPDITKAMRELQKANNNASPAALNELI